MKKLLGLLCCLVASWITSSNCQEAADHAVVPQSDPEVQAVSIGLPENPYEMEEQAGAELRRLCQVHPDANVRQDFSLWISTEKIPVIYHYNSEAPGIFFDHKEGTLFVNPAYLLSPETPETCQFLDLEHEYIHARWYLEGLPEFEVLKQIPPLTEEQIPAFAKASFHLEVEAYWAQAKLACQLEEESFYPTLCEAVKKWDRQAFRKALYELLIQSPYSEEEKKLHPYWKEEIDQPTE